jgi:cytoskeleton protein RodZ
MTEIDEDESRATANETAGSLLKAAREAAGMTLEQAAEKLHLLKETVIALEEEDASKLPSRVFTLGYLKNYARILDLPESRIMGLARVEVKDVKAVKNLQQPRAHKIRIRRRHQVNGGRLFVKVASGLIAIAIVVLLVLWWRGAIQSPDLSGLSFFSTTEKQESVGASSDDGSETLTLSISDGQASENETQQDVTAAQDIAEKSSDEELLELPLERAGDETTAEAKGGADAGEKSEETSEETTTASQTAEKIAVSDDAVVIAADTAAENIADDEHEVTLDFSDNCWVNVNDAEGKIVLFGDIPGGSRKTLEGKAPFTFVLGNATKVKVSVGGRAYDIAPHIKGGVARFSLGDPVE